MNTSSHKENNSVGTMQKIAFGIGMLGNQMFPASLGIFIVVLIQNLGFSPLLYGVIAFIPRFFDAITDPIMGFISDNTRSKYGKRRQYVFLGAIITGISFILMWQLYIENGIVFNFWYFLLCSLGFYLGITIFGIPFVAMGYEMSEDFHERTKIMAVSQFIGQFAWIIAPWIWVIIYDPNIFTDPASGTRELSIYIGIACTIFAITPALFIKSRSTINDDHLVPLTRKNIGASFSNILNIFKDAYKNIPFRKLCLATFLVFNSFQTIAAFSFFIIVHYLFSGDASSAGIWPTLHGSIGALITTLLVIPVVSKMAQKFGKKQTFIVTQSISIIGYILFWFLFIPGKPYMFLYALPFFSFGIGGLFTIMMSMTADVCDYEELQNGLPRKEGTFGAIYWWMVKLGTALAGLFAGLIMWYVGFAPDSATQPEGALTGLRFFYTFIPILGTSLAIYVMWDYDIDEKRAKEIKDELLIKNNA
jgi:GPH family glycoside/pentoside/hexuronide:cation symporter|tara:strand:- start:458 stop:1885 length:1428 start_codon:yes stop_codon:yes gene_type:complete